jgi:hypothetical protein
MDVKSIFAAMQRHTVGLDAIPLLDLDLFRYAKMIFYNISLTPYLLWLLLKLEVLAPTKNAFLAEHGGVTLVLCDEQQTVRTGNFDI